MSLSEYRRVRGIFFEHPILNAILEAIERWRQRWRKRLSGQHRLRDVIETTSTTEGKTKIYENVEEYSIFEEPSGVIKVRVKRKAERGQ